MRLYRRVERLGRRVPGPKSAGIPTDPAVLLAGLLAGRVRLDAFDRTDADQVSALATAAATPPSRYPEAGAAAGGGG
ncbi:MAG TPA: hypothetical protein VH092_22185 [Urbifossiella sp.]|jgi:hypothetical protein|nr:hypothetical protein [Urbifossiella sp.]